ncbi:MULTISPECIES: S41 family peptidase [unclassified Duganella]|uniref:S41 family peptidase n=1 Tax=unclassified Duganella TaxID=2636909 RepID=UPI0008867BF7|nr:MULTISPECIES: S41 family peptidase [unclassified Duganella]SDG97395.1 PDZ domain-containing protein [Duganella sp. OV458]SDJ45072.1 PDZ domain-containing protein [Duganella sp. OV510]
MPDFLTLANHCANPRQGTQPNGLPYYDGQGTLTEEMRWLRSFIDEGYLWYKEVPANLNMADYKTVLDYFAVLKTPLITASGQPKDRFHFTYPSEVWEAMSGAGVTLGYGITWSRSTGATPRVYVVTMVEPDSPASKAGVLRGDTLVSVDGADATTSTALAALSPTAAGQTHAFALKRGESTQTFSLTSQKVTEAAVQNTRVISTSTGAVGYLQFNDHNAIAERQLLDAFTTLKAANVSDLVLDMRYNGGGYLLVASELAYMIAGPAATDGKVFERLQLNDKRPPQAPQMFRTVSYGLAPTSLKAGVTLPYLGLKRVTVLTTAGTCSASESVINSLRGIDVEVNLIGGETCGKPYAFVPQENCGTTYFAIQMQGANNKGFGDYADGFQATCKADDDLDHALGDSSERLLATALSYRANGVCPATPLRARSSSSTGPLQLLRPVGKEIALRPR